MDRATGVSKDAGGSWLETRSVAALLTMRTSKVCGLFRAMFQLEHDREKLAGVPDKIMRQNKEKESAIEST